MIRKKFTRTIEYNAIQFDPKDHSWHRSIQRTTVNGKIPKDSESYSCIIPCDRIVTIRPGDWIIVDDMGNAQGVIDQTMISMGLVKGV